MFVFEILVVLGLLLLVALAIMLAASLTLSMPLADLINSMLRKIGLAGAYKGSRAIGGHGVGIVDEPFTAARGATHAEGKLFAKGELWNARCDPALARRLHRGDEVTFLYDQDLTVTVVGKSGESPPPDAS